MTVRHLAVPSYVAGAPAPADTKSYLDPTIARASTPDVAIPAGDITWVFKLQGPSSAMGATPGMICGQWQSGGNLVYATSRAYSSQVMQSLVASDGTSAAAKGTSGGTPTGADEYLAFTYPASSAGVVVWTSADKGATWTILNTGTASANKTFFDSAVPIYVGDRDGTGGTTKFQGRIYYCEMRASSTPQGGTLLWRFDADDHVSGTTWTDPRGKAWTLTAAGGITHPSSYIFTENWNTADDTHWDWAKWPIQRPYYTIASNQGVVTPSGGPSVASSSKYLSDFEMTVKMTWLVANPSYPELCWRLYDGLGGYGASSGYIIQIKPNGRVDIYRVGAYSDLGAGGGVDDASLAAAGTRWFKVRVVGNNHKVKWWNDGSAEPGTWQLDATDTAPLTDTQGAPIVGGAIGFRSYGDPPIYVDDLTVTDLASPPLPVADGSLRTLSNGKAIAMNGASSAFASDTDLTWCGWVKYSAASGNSWAVWSLFSGGSVYCITSITPAGEVRQYNDTGDIGSGYTVPFNTWVFVAMSRSITGGTDLYWAPAGTSTLSTVHNASVGTVTGLKLRVLSDEYGSNPYANGCAFKCWTAALTKTQLEAEMPTYAVQRTANLFLHYSMKNGMYYAPDNDPLNDSKWLWWEQGGLVSGPKATHLT